MEGFYFYWCSWACWIFATFLMKKTKARTMLAAAVLISIMLSIYHITIGVFSITLSFLFALVIAYYFITKKSGWKLVYMLLSMMMVSFVYAACHLLILIDPVWMLIDKTWMVAIMLTFVCLMLHHHFQERLLCIIAGSCQGEMMYAFVIKTYSFPYAIGSLAFLDELSLSCVCLALWSALENISVYADMVHKQMKRNKPLL
ncbi:MULTISPECIES: YphA family membrane protein [Anoxybacillaceae]|nr:MULTISPECIES: hypothetical protein [Anoxybacillus]MBS2770245.1 hypothetical protein [Anoxybacillus rupiensis]QHC04569.1 hypothetical protein GRQ40_11875 [Anoxybacillus sp. PDR2]